MILIGAKLATSRNKAGEIADDGQSPQGTHVFTR
jgi:hypothetical protein